MYPCVGDESRDTRYVSAVGTTSEPKPRDRGERELTEESRSHATAVNMS